MTPKYTWTAADRAKVTAGCTVEVHSPMLTGRFEIAEVADGWLSLDDGGYTASITYGYADPESVVAPKQTVMF